MLKPELFDQLLAAYPAEKRELARQIYSRFSEGDSTHFFTRLFIVLDLYAVYAERIPQAVMDANAKSVAHWQKLREECNLLGQALDRRNLNIANHAEATNELCRQAIAKCTETITKLEVLPRELGERVDTKGIVDSVRRRLEEGIQREIIAPFIQRSDALTKLVLPTLNSLKKSVRGSSCLLEREHLEDSMGWEFIGGGLGVGLNDSDSRPCV